MPNPANPQSWNRYGYVSNNPIKFIDPTGHKLIEGAGFGGCLPDIIDPPDEGDDDDTGLTIPIDTEEIANYVPGTAEQWATGAKVLDYVALGYDTLLGLYVLAWTGVGCHHRAAW